MKIGGSRHIYRAIRSTERRSDDIGPLAQVLPRITVLIEHHRVMRLKQKTSNKKCIFGWAFLTGARSNREKNTWLELVRPGSITRAETRSPLHQSAW